ncbi:DMT family transporter [Sinisalibacter aestuarii]|uniref:Membrane protein n=1 Tax=Sinisalibacter aestuarii TaxID=2949426 RepID=A0ABQ5LU59_9RHOB|nr:DMT family transporter [Sinisalibacter aestuarii]GKY88508.1 membrane protein [Sinisalibacter aestuarii]
MTQALIRSDNLRGAGLMIVAMAAFTFNDTTIKSLAGSLPLAQTIFLRGLISTGLMVGVAWWMGGLRLRLPRRDWGLILIRSFADLGATFLFLGALFYMPLANLTAILQALPLSVALGAALFFHEPLGWRRLLAIAIGFIGVLLIVRPGADGFNTYALWGLGAVGFVTLRDLAARRLSRETPSVMAALVGAAVITLAAGVATLVDGWAPVEAVSGGKLVLAGLFILAGYLASVAVMRVGEIGFTAPFRYTGLLWALVLGWLVFDEWPDGITLIGAGIVVATGIFTLYREELAARRMRRASVAR